MWADIEDELYSEWLFDKLEQELEVQIIIRIDPVGMFRKYLVSFPKDARVSTVYG